jgi:hypothetical protein
MIRTTFSTEEQRLRNERKRQYQRAVQWTHEAATCVCRIKVKATYKTVYSAYLCIVRVSSHGYPPVLHDFYNNIVRKAFLCKLVDDTATRHKQSAMFELAMDIKNFVVTSNNLSKAARF